MNYQNFIEIDNKKKCLFILNSSLFIIFFGLTISSIYLLKNSNNNKLKPNSTNDYILLEGEFIDDLKSKYRGILQYSGQFSSSDVRKPLLAAVAAIDLASISATDEICPF